ncbi:methionine-rich copper-binding protein CopC [Croceifilum oryzae]|uniref:Methionine-rich copper-binding protein CopC n=1 Tax=Croceifilum oryzae TaxID=1553429 RepID=A0AAJ1TFG6_9BACL|nr:hypothetical protein [Croceifilum oryzae]MDQ0417459.1 methionine-rich copper-binding protein CopC [Croceifilum oryzae]
MSKLSRILVSFLLFMGTLFPINQVRAEDRVTLPTPKEIAGFQLTETPGTWQLGAIPPNVDLNKPPVVFVQGRSRHAQDWWSKTEYHGINDMYEMAYNAGYRTVFVHLHDSAGKGTASPYDNGQLLAKSLKEISQHYGQKVNIVAHSKGGIDAQAALVHYNAYPYVGKIVTLGSPNYGSHLADMAYSWYASWLTKLVGEQDAGAYSLQTGEMEKFRKQTDHHPNVMKNDYYTTAGTSWGPSASALWLAGLTLSSYGENDGLVNISSTYLPYGTHLFTIPADHDSIRKGSVSFQLMEPVLRSAAPTKSPKMAFSQAMPKPTPSTQAADQSLAGGSLSANQPIEKSISIDAKEATVQIMTKSPDVKVTLQSPSGKVYDKSSSNYVLAKGDELFGDVTDQSFQLKGEETGNWKVRIQSPSKDAYFLVTSYKGSQDLSLDLPSPESTKESSLKLKMNQSENYDSGSMNVDVKVIDSEGKEVKQQLQEKGYQSRMKRDVRSSNEYTVPLPTDVKPGLYNITVQVTGKKKSGKSFERTLVKSVYIGK